MPFLARSPAETRALARRLAAVLRANDVVALFGGLGAGKTVFAAALKEALGAVGPLQSPTFTLLRSYPARPSGLAFHHFDAYRLAGSQDWYGLGFDEWLDQNGVTAIEWAERIADALPERSIRVTLAPGDDEDSRRIGVCFPKGDPRALSGF